MTPAAMMSPKRPLAESAGFALRLNKQASYTMRWHTHDCAMLLWPRIGGLRSAWRGAEDGDERETSEPGAARMTLSRGTALLLSAATPHSTRSVTPRQQHGELYLMPEWLGDCRLQGAIHLDGACQAMLDALSSPALTPRGAALLLPALIAQLTASRPVDPQRIASPPPSRQLVRLFQAMLDEGRPLPTIDEAAATLGLSTRRLQRCCQREFGITPVTLRRRMLAAEIGRLLEQGHGVSELSAQFGFAHGGHLNRLLRSISG